VYSQGSKVVTCYVYTSHW